MSIYESVKEEAPIIGGAGIGGGALGYSALHFMEDAVLFATEHFNGEIGVYAASEASVLGDAAPAAAFTAGATAAGIAGLYRASERYSPDVPE